MLRRVSYAHACAIAMLCACSANAPADNSRAGRATTQAGSGASTGVTAGTGTDTSAATSAGGAKPLVPTVVPATSQAGASAQAGAGGAMMTTGPVSIDQTGANNPAGLAPDEVQRLIAGGPTANMRFLYPYEGTVFPRGLLAPLLMWDGAVPDAVYVRIKSQTFEYKSVLKPDPQAPAPQLALANDMWAEAGRQTHGPSDVFTLELTARAGGTVAGPITLHFNIAQATVKGSIYYNTYSSRLPGAAAGGNVLRVPSGGTAEPFLSFACNGCHSVSADGSRMISQVALAVGGNSFQLTSGGMANPAGMVAGPRTSFGALYPDGSKYLATSVVIEVARSFLTQGLGGPMEATLYDTTSGQVVPDTGVPPGALMPMFSPDGTRLAFNDFAIAEAHGLALMDYDTATNKASNYRVLTQGSGALRPAWPFVLPDNKAVVFVNTDAADFSGGGAGLLGTLIAAPMSDLYIVDIATGESVMLARAMGFNTPADAVSGTTYLPFGAEDLHHSYFPTLSPVAAGGYFWVFFDAVRHFGNLGLQRQLWGAAIEIRPDGRYGLDPSHPAFYLPGQEFGTGNHRAFAALDPCKKDGDTCTSGIDCCGGSCYFPEQPQEFADPLGTCMPPKQNTCAKRDERCKIDADCCPAEPNQAPYTCIAGFCAAIVLN